jgi:hypothetical protein
VPPLRVRGAALTQPPPPALAPGRLARPLAERSAAATRVAAPPRQANGLSSGGGACMRRRPACQDTARWVPLPVHAIHSCATHALSRWRCVAAGGRGGAGSTGTGGASLARRAGAVWRARARLGAAVRAAQVDEVEHLRAAQWRRARLLLQHRIHELGDARGHRRPLRLPARPEPPWSGARARPRPAACSERLRSLRLLTACRLPARVAHTGQVGAGRQRPGLSRARLSRAPPAALLCRFTGCGERDEQPQDADQGQAGRMRRRGGRAHRRSAASSSATIENGASGKERRRLQITSACAPAERRAPGSRAARAVSATCAHCQQADRA